MTAEERSFCKYCRRRDDYEHHDACPLRLDTSIAMEKWQKGREHGFQSDYPDVGRIPPWAFDHYNPTYILGYEAGKAEIDRLVDEAALSRSYWGEEY